MENQGVTECIKGLQKLLSIEDFATDCSTDTDLCQILSDGEILCTVLTQLSNGRISNDNGTYSAVNSQFMARSNLKFFLDQCQEEFGMQEDELFEPDDLLALSNPEKVVNSITKLLNQPDREPPTPRRQSNVSIGGGVIENVIKEICEHENALVDKLAKLLRYRRELLGLLSEWSEDFVQVVFKHTEQLYLVHKEFHEKLVALASQGYEQFCMQLHTLYNEMAPKLEVYKHYFSQLTVANTRMEEEFRKSPGMKTQLNMLERHFNNGQGGLTFRALFDAPIRQLTSYLLLFKRLQEAAEKEIPHAAPLVGEAAVGMSDLLDRANEFKRQAEQLALTEALLGQIGDLPPELADPALIGLHLADECFRVKTVKDRKAESQICTCLVTTKQLIVSTGLQKKECQATLKCSIPITSIIEVIKCEKTFSLEVIQGNGEKVVFECLKRNNELLEKWKKLLEDTRSLNLPNGWNSEGHRFELMTLPEGTKCTKCKLTLPSSVMQGYSCSHCNEMIHVHCFRLVITQRRSTAPCLPSRPWSAAFYHKNVTRRRAQEILAKSKVGAYLIRDNRYGGKALSLHTGNDNIEHINILEEADRVALGNNVCWFQNMDKMIQYYSENSLSVHFSGIDCRLVFGIPTSSGKRFLPKCSTVDETR